MTTSKHSYQQLHWTRSYWNIPQKWSFLPLGELFDQRRERSSDKTAFPLYSLTIEDGVTEKTERYERSFLLKDGDNNEFAVVRPGDFVSNPMNPRFGAIGCSRVPFPVLVSGYYDVLTPKLDKIDPRYLEAFLRSPWAINLYDRIAIGSLIEKRRVHLSILTETFIPLPPLPEQQKIAAILSTWDRAIELTEKLIAAKQKRKQALMQQLLTGKDVKAVALSSILKPTKYPVPKPDEPYTALGIRSHCKGTFQRPVDDPASVAMDTLYAVKQSELIVNITFAWEGAIAVVKPEDEGCFVSHRFPTYAIDAQKADIDFVRHLVTMPRFIFQLGFISPGGAGRNRVLSKTDFMKLKVKLPHVDEQRRIGKILMTATKVTTLLARRLDALKRQKKGLMQQLLTGKVRVNVDAEMVQR